MPLKIGFLLVGNSAERSRKIRFIAPETVRKFCGKFAEISRKFFCNDPFPNDPTSILLRCWVF